MSPQASSCRRESEPARYDDRVDLEPDQRRDSAPASSEHFDAAAFHSALTVPEGPGGRPPKAPSGSGKWRSKVGVSNDKQKDRGYKRTHSAEQLHCQVCKIFASTLLLVPCKSQGPVVALSKVSALSA